MVRVRALFCAACLCCAALRSSSVSSASATSFDLPKPQLDLVLGSLLAGAVLGRLLCTPRPPKHKTSRSLRPLPRRAHLQ